VASSGERATLASIASAAGVSVATVSKVVNGRPDVAATTRVLVQDLLEEHEYVPRRVDRAGPASVALFFNGPLETYSLEIMEGMLGVAAERDVEVVLSRTDIGLGGSAQWLRQVHLSGRQAVIAVTSEAAELAALARIRLPVVVIDPLATPQRDIASVGSTNFTGGIAATEHLLQLGHRRIAYLGGTATASCNQARLQGYRAAMEAAGAKVAKGYVRSGRFRYEDGLVEGGALLDLPRRPTAIFAANDETALGILEAARARGLRVPEDLSLVGFDDTEVARVASPQLTTVAQPLRRMGAVALRTALRLANGERIDAHHVELATELIVRNSTAAPA
jgi:LacI family transcriptional regulator, galactose operon repressor